METPEISILAETDYMVQKQDSESIATVGVILEKSDTDNALQINDPKEWIKEHIVQNSSLSRMLYFQRLGIKDSRQISKETFEEINRMTKSEILDKVGEISEIDEKNLMLEKSYSSGSFLLNFLIKTDDEIRRNFIDRLTSMRIIKSQPAKHHQSRINHLLEI